MTHLVDIIDPDQKYSAGRFVLDATQSINLQKKIPILIGGNWLYALALIYGMAQSKTSKNGFLIFIIR